MVLLYINNIVLYYLSLFRIFGNPSKGDHTMDVKKKRARRKVEHIRRIRILVPYFHVDHRGRRWKRMKIIVKISRIYLPEPKKRKGSKKK